MGSDIEILERDDGFVQSLARGLSVIEAFQPGRERQTMAQIAGACQLTRAGARRLLLTLQSLGYVTLEGRYFSLSPRILELSQGHVPQSVWERARPHLEDATVALDAATSAGVLDGGDVVYMLRVRPQRPVHLALATGTHLPAYASAMGRVLLAALPRAGLEDYLQHTTLTKLTAHTVVDADVLRQDLSDTRSRGWSCLRGEIEEGLSCVAVPLVDRAGATLAALHVSLNCRRAEGGFVENRVVPTVQKAAVAIAAAL
jgi:IclR family pca regulon transcriptional regulator